MKRFSKPESFRLKKYEDYRKCSVLKGEKVKEISEKISESFKRENKAMKTTVFVTFENNFERNFILNNNNNYLIHKLKGFIPFYTDRSRFQIAVGVEKDASEPAVQNHL